MSDSSDLIYWVLSALQWVGFLVILIAEILILSTSNWVTRSQAFLYPIVTFIVNIVAAFIVSIVYIFVAYFLGISLGMALMGLDQQITGNTDSVKIGLILSILIIAVLMYFVYLAVFFVVRFVTTKMIIRPQTLTWKYISLQAAILAAVCSIGMPLMQILSALSST